MLYHILPHLLLPNKLSFHVELIKVKAHSIDTLNEHGQRNLPWSALWTEILDKYSIVMINRNFQDQIKRSIGNSLKLKTDHHYTIVSMKFMKYAMNIYLLSWCNIRSNFNTWKIATGIWCYCNLCTQSLFIKFIYESDIVLEIFILLVWKVRKSERLVRNILVWPPADKWMKH